MRRNPLLKSSPLLLLAVVSLAFGCSGGPSYSAEVTQPPVFADPLGELRDQQLLRFTLDGVDHEAPLDESCGGEDFCMVNVPSELNTFMADYLATADTSCPDIDGTPADGACSEITCIIETGLSRLNFLLDIAGQAGPTTYQSSTQTLYVPVQSKATQAGLRETTLLSVSLFAGLGMSVVNAAGGGNVGNGISYTWTGPDLPGSDENCSAHRDPQDASTNTWLEAMTVAILEMSQLAQESAVEAADDYIAIADSEFGRRAALDVASHAARNIRGHAAHLLVGGGSNRYQGSSEDPSQPAVLPLVEDDLTCYSAQLLGLENKAYDVLREVALAPSLIQAIPGESPSPVDLDTLLTGSNGVNVRDRYGLLRGIEDDTASMSADTFLQHLGVGRSDFASARSFMAEQIRVFARSSLIVPNEVIPGLTGPDAAIYAGTRGAGSAPPHWMYYAGLISDPGVDHQHQFAPDTENRIPSLASAGIPNAGLVAIQAMLMGSIVAQSGDFNAAEGSHARNLAESGARIRDGSSPLGSLFYGGTDDTGTDRLLIAGTVVDDPARYALATTHGELQCALTGRRDGIPCTPDQLALLPAQAIAVGGLETIVEDLGFADDAAGATGLVAGFAEGRNPLGWTAVAAPAFERFYVLRTRDESGTHRGPGAWEALAAGHVYRGDYQDHINLNPYYMELAGNLMTPSNGWCAQPSVSCAQTSFDGRIPLEDELTDDGNAHENSWRRYLDIAAQAANEADALGVEAQGASLEIDRISEGAIEELEQICGAVLTLDPLKACAYDHTGACPNDLVGILNTYPANEDGDISRFRRCLGLDGEMDYATTGSEQLCVWYKDGDPTQLCQVDENDRAHNDLDGNGQPSPNEMFAWFDANGDGAYQSTQDDRLRCPRFLSDEDSTNGCRVPESASGSQYTPFLVGGSRDLSGDLVPQGTRALLGIFTPPSTSGAEDEVFSCGSIRELRESIVDGTDEAELQRLLELVFLTDSGDVDPRWFPDRMAETTGAMNWTAKPGTYTDITVNGGILISTGDASTGPNTSGICAPLPRDPYGCAVDPNGPSDYPNSIFCGYETCDPWGYSELPSRLAYAAQTARLISGLGYEGFTFPRRLEEAPATPIVSSYTIHSPAGSIEGPVLLHEGNQHNSDHPQSPHLDYRTWYADGWDSEATGNQFYLSFETPYPDTDGDSGPLFYPNQGSTGYYNQPGTSWDLESSPARDLAIANAYAFSKMLTNLHQLGSLITPTENVARWATLLLEDGIDREITASHHVPGLEGSASNSSSFAAPSRPFSTDNNYYPAFLGAELTWADLLDAMELTCEAAERGVSRRFGCGGVQPIQSARQLDFASEQLECAAGEINSLGASIVLYGLPISTLDALREQSTVGAVPVDGGEYAQSISRIRQRLIALSLTPSEITSELNGMARDTRRVGVELNRSDIQSDIAEIDLRRDAANQITNCVTATASIADGGVFSVYGGIVAAAATCANSAFQITSAVKSARLQSQIVDANRDLLLMEVEESLARRVEALEGLGKQMIFEIEGLEAELSHLESVQRRAERAAYRALFLEDPAVQSAFSSASSLRQRYETSTVRYERAKRDAIQMAFLAKLAIEQRFGVSLASMSEEMTLVGAPSSWESSLCLMDGMNLQTGRQDGNGTMPESFADGYIGDYVHKLERFVDSYRLDYPFSDGTDTAVVSVRDDIVGSRAVCETVVGNWLLHSNELEATLATLGSGWGAFGCTTDVLGNPEPNCVVASPTPEDPTGALGSTVDFPTEYGSIQPFRLSFGTLHPDCVAVETCPCSTLDCGWNPTVLYGQQMELTPGSYRVSWYARPGTDDQGNPRTPLDASSAMVIRDASTLNDTLIQSQWSGAALDGFVRYSGVAQIGQAGTFIVGIRTPSGDPASPDVAPGTTIDVGGMMVERLLDQSISVAAASEPPPFAVTGFDNTHPLAVCEDTDGMNFRRDAWTRHCEFLCDTGFGQSCGVGEGTEYCFWETSFHVGSAAIDRGEVFGHSGFARGNFNYRIESIGVNFVGTGSRTCADASLPSTCYSAGWIPYSIEHTGPFEVSNHFGDLYEAPLFDGRIEHARGLAAERYLTNPISSADQGLIGQYQQLQFRGRPLTGTYRLRVWDEPGVNFEGIEDVQLVLGYRYWTRQN